MKFNLKLSFIFLLLSSSSNMGHALEPVPPYEQQQYPAANLKLSANIFNGGCIVNSTTENMTVALGTVDTKQFQSPNSRSLSIPFAITLTGCTADFVILQIIGNANQKFPDHLALNSDQALADFLSIQIFKEDKTIYSINNEALKIRPNAQKVAAFKFTANYYSEYGNVPAGSANATAQFTLLYD